MLDGFPRTPQQAEAIDGLLAAEHLRLDAVINYELPAADLIAHIAGRRVCPACKAVFHVTGRPPAVAGVCDQCGGQLEQRADDRPEAVQVRLEAYAADTMPLIAHYRALNLLVPIHAHGRPEEVFARTLDALAALVLPR
jgi:adenylate kinase